VKPTQLQALDIKAL